MDRSGASTRGFGGGESKVVYVLIANHRTVLEESLILKIPHSISFFREISFKINEKLQTSTHNQSATYYQQGFTFVSENVEGVLYLCVTTSVGGKETESEKSKNKKFLKDLRTRYVDAQPPPGAFRPQIITLLEEYNQETYPPNTITPPPSTTMSTTPLTNSGRSGESDSQSNGGSGSNRTVNDKVGEIKAKVDDVKGIMIQNLDRILDRGEKFNEILDQSERLVDESNRFRENSTILRRNLWWKNIRFLLIVSFSLLVILLIIAMYYCGFGLSRCK
eukprot:TRINITY_DN8079_c0_g1_i1.p1 TRINITY_DN8079_c0_g1~~TRINITY_DN8079_c0_g1_i1.p1  ORF type:complete len:294 (-),score=51.34 TRINITY_DN8079_c0_g1_i1:51-881(-)